MLVRVASSRNQKMHGIMRIPSREVGTIFCEDNTDVRAFPGNVEKILNNARDDIIIMSR